MPRAESRRPTARRAFSLVEVLLAIFILGIGIISIAALFPAGIAQQRLAGDDVMGPTVANHAMSIIRSKVSAEDFGTFEDFWDINEEPAGFFTRTIRGDWGWMRPSFLLEDFGPTALFNEAGTIDVFSHFRYGQDKTLPDFPPPAFQIAAEHHEGWPDVAPVADRLLYGIPFNRRKHQSALPPRILISQQERYYPMHSQLVQIAHDPPRPQYVWDCMFRRYNGRIYVAILVYRVSSQNAPGAANFVVQPNPSNSTVPPLPIAIDMTPGGSPWPTPPWDIAYDAGRPIPEVRGFLQNDFHLFDENQGWQAQRQWILDQNNNIHRVLANRRPGPNDSGNAMVIELARPLVPVRLAKRPGANNDNPYLNAPDTTDDWPSFGPDEYYEDPSQGPANPALTNQAEINAWFPNFDRGVVTRFWYIPLRMENEALGVEYSLTPVYVTVKEL